jgi:hypothetical protein
VRFGLHKRGHGGQSTTVLLIIVTLHQLMVLKEVSVRSVQSPRERASADVFSADVARVGTVEESHALRLDTGQPGQGNLESIDGVLVRLALLRNEAQLHGEEDAHLFLWDEGRTGSGLPSRVATRLRGRL